MKNRTNLIFLHKLIKAVADSLVKVFIPLIILKNSGDLLYVVGYLTIYYILCTLNNILLKNFLQKYGVIAIVLHTIPVIVLQFVLNMTIDWYIIVILALLASYTQVLYSVPINLLFAFTDREVNVAKFEIGTNIGKLLFILISGYILGSDYKNSLIILSIVGAVLYIASVIPIVYGYKLLKESYIKASIRANKYAGKPRHYKTYNIFHMCFSLFQGVLDMLIPIYLYLNNLTFEAVAIVVAMIEVFKIFANIFAKYLVDKGKSMLSVSISLVCFFIGVVVLLVIKIPVVLYIGSSLVATSFPLLFVPMFRHFCNKIKKDDYQFDGMSYRDVYIFTGKIIMYIPYFICPSLIPSFVIGILAGIGMGLCAYIILNRIKKKSAKA